MERWVPLLDIFLNSPSPEGEASLWMQQQQSQLPLLSTSAFLSLLLKPHNTNRCIWIQTLPNTIQSRILSFLSIESQRFSSQHLHSLVTHILNSPPQHHEKLDFWVEKAARNLLDTISSKNPTSFHSFNSNSVKGVDKEEEFSTLPDWLRNHTSTGSFLPWLPLSSKALDIKIEENICVNDNVDKASIIVIDNDSQEDREVVGSNESAGIMIEPACVPTLDPEIHARAAALKSHQEDREVVGSNELAGIMIEPACVPTLDPEIHARAAALKSQMLTCNSVSETISLANRIIQLCFDTRVGDPFAILGLIEPWEANDEITSILLSHLLSGREDVPNWSIQVLSSLILPQLLVLRDPASRLLAATTIECCKLHQKAAVDAILLPLVLCKEGINTPVCDLITRIVKECLRPAHVSAFCQKLLCGEEHTRRLVCLPCHMCLISNKLVWTEPLFTLFQNILNLNVHLTPDSIGCIVSSLDEMADLFSKSLKFGSFFLCFVSKCAPSLKVHRVSLMKTAQKTETFMTKSILLKLSTK